jgi:hypothetical protein
MAALQAMKAAMPCPLTRRLSCASLPRHARMLPPRYARGERWRHFHFRRRC